MGCAPVQPAPAGRTGRRPGKPDTRAHILQVAGEVFRRDGFAAASVRGIAREAGVDQALVHRYFGTKRELLLAVVRIDFDPTRLPALIMSGGREGIGVRVMTAVPALWESPMGASLLASIRENPAMLVVFAKFINTAIVEAAMKGFGYGRREAELRAGLIEAQMLGLVQARHYIPLDSVASISREDLIRLYAPLMQHLIADDLGISGARHKSSSDQAKPS